MGIWIFAGIILLLALAALAGGAAALFRYAVVRPKKPADQEEEPVYDGSVRQQAVRKGLAFLERLPREELSCRSADGLKLYGTFFPAEKPSRQTVLAIHGYHATGWKEYSVFAEFYHSMGFNLLLPDNRAHGKSEGKYIGFGNLDRFDCVLWAEYLAKRFGPGSRILLHGVSMGAATVLSAAGEPLPQQVAGVVADCGYTSAWDQFSWQLKQMFHLPAFPVLPVCGLICRLRAGYGFRKNSPIRQARKIKVPVLIVHGDQDDFVPTHMAQLLYDACPGEKRLLLVKGARHAESMAVAPGQYRQALRDFWELCTRQQPEKSI